MKKMGRSITNESEDGVLSTDSPLSNDADHSGGSSGGGVVLKKGPWTSAEDAILIDYVKKHGEGNWNAVQKHSGLSRCGKSCRLRWANHLRPNLKKGAFTPEEEQLIIELHAKMGNKWARMAAHLPGRTDNEIKNYWNTRIKRRQRAGLPLYPPELCLQAAPEVQQSHNSHGLYGGDKGCHGILQTDRYMIPDFIFDSSNILPYTPDFPNISASGSLVTGFGCPQFYNFASKKIELQKSAQDPDELMSDYGGGAADEAPSSDRVHNDNCENKISQPVDLCFAYKPDTRKLLPLGAHQDSHFMSNGFLSTSKPFAGAEKLELPSLQYPETGLGVWDPAPEPIDSFVQSSIGGQLPSDYPSPRSSGLLEALLHEAKVLSKSDNQFSDKATLSTIRAGDVTNGFALKTCSSDFKGYLDPTSPSANSMGSIFNECAPTHTIGSSLEEKMPAGLVKSEAFDQSWTQLDCYRPEAMLGSPWLEQSASCSKQQGFEHDSIAAFLRDDLGSELNMPAGTCACSWGLGSCTWNNMPAACLSDHQ